MKRVVEHPGPGLAIRTEFSYDLRDAVAAARFKTTVRDGRGHDTLYVLNGDGSPTRIEEPLGKTTVLTWAANDVLKLSERERPYVTKDFGLKKSGSTRKKLRQDWNRLTALGSVDIVNQAASPEGAGWSFNNVEQLVPVSGGVILVEPGGTSLWFANATQAGLALRTAIGMAAAWACVAQLSTSSAAAGRGIRTDGVEGAAVER